MAPVDDDVVREKSTFRCLDAARYALAFVVTVLIVTVIAHAIAVVLRPEKLILRVVGGSVQVEDIATWNLTLRFTLRAINPSGRVRIYYTNIDCHLRGKIEPASPAAAKNFLRFPLPDMSVPGRLILDANAQPYGDNTSMPLPFQRPYFNMLYNGSGIHDAMLLLTGTLVTEIHSGYNKTDDRPAIYCCSSLTVGGDSSEYRDVLCKKDDPICNTT